MPQTPLGDGSWRIALLTLRINRQAACHIACTLEIRHYGDDCAGMKILVRCDRRVEVDFVGLAVRRGIDDKQSSAQVDMDDLSRKGVTGSGKSEDRNLAGDLVAVPL